jgi:SAM-dependent methyltransferase
MPTKPRQLQWAELEEVVASVVKKRYEALASDDARRRFLWELRRADWTLSRLAREIDRDPRAPRVSYAASRTGEAYALRHHLSRADNAVVVLREFDPLVRAIRAGLVRRLAYLLFKSVGLRWPHRADRCVRMLDIGSGTGSGAMALWFDAHTFRVSYGLTNLHVTAAGVEPATPMRAMADAILDALRERLAEAEQLDADTARATYACEYAPARSLEELVHVPAPREFDIILFCYTFGPEHVLDPGPTLQHVRQIARRLCAGGRLLFLTPERPAEKLEFMNRIAHELRSAGMRHWKSRLRGYHPHDWWRASSLALSKNPPRVIETRLFLNRECQRMRMGYVYGDDSRFGYPYYGLYARCDVFAWRK